jgi:hypothetical protein
MLLTCGSLSAAIVPCAVPILHRRRERGRRRVIRYHFDVSTLLPPVTRTDDEWDRLRRRLTEAEALLADRRAEFARTKAGLDAFEVRYRHKVGTLHEQLDALELAIAEAELGEIAKRLKDAPGTSPPPRDPAARPASATRLTSDAVRTLFRDVAKAIHPDLAGDEAARHRRHALMIEANRAYALGDEEQLRIILQAWEQSPDAVVGSDPAARRLRIVRRIAQVERELDAIAEDAAALHESPLGKLKALVDEAAAGGKDLVRDMIGRLKRDILAATNRLDALRPPE